MRRSFLRLSISIALATSIPGAAAAQSYPARPIRLLVGYPPGGNSDITARVIGQVLTQRVGQAVVIENKPGAGSNIALEAVANSKPDGYTLAFVSTANAINATLFEGISFDILRDFTPVASLTQYPSILVASASFQATSLPDVIAYAKANPGKVNLGSASIGSIFHLSGELLKSQGGINLTNIPFRGGAPQLTALLANEVQLGFDGIPSVLEHIRAGKLRALGVTGAQRSKLLPDVPTIGEVLPGYEATGWNGIAAPKNTPTDIVAKLNVEINTSLADPALRQRYAEIGLESFVSTPVAFDELIRLEVAKWAKVVKSSGAKPE